MLYEINNHKTIFIIAFAMLFGIFSSCKYYNSINQERMPYMSEFGYKNIYLVDTIRIEEPVSYITEGNYWVVTNAETFNKLKKYNDEVLLRNDVFLFEREIPLIPIEMLDFYTERVSCLQYDKMEDVPQSIQAKKYREPITFNFFLVNRKFYNERFTGIDGSPEVNFGKDCFYFKLLIPK
ncbi:MAG: hypothetical protein J6T28_06095 [Paludibacteraceae bacterium]|nr:hypothetical protein [Paludibacteraceae bacterium]